ncbi:hypothetical protein STEG23_030505, partial [Scotinomys teguina]
MVCMRVHNKAGAWKLTCHYLEPAAARAKDSRETLSFQVLVDQVNNTESCCPEEKMFGFHKPKMYRSIEGCCICRAKSSSSRFTDSKRYEKDFQSCFG